MKLFFFVLVVLTTQSFAGVYVNNLWRTQEVSVCFAEGEKDKRETSHYVLKVKNWSKKNKANVQKWVMEEYSVERTGIHFTGFLDCQESPYSDVIIFYNKNSRVGTFLLGGTHGLAVMGPHPGIVKGYSAASGFVSISSSGMDKGTVIHEFGHTAGLQHEHLHHDAYKIEKGKCPAVKGPQFSTYFRYTEYDPESVMNYCRIHGKGGSKAGLSKNDVGLLRQLYP